jgi:predicted nucleic acid-binding protein
MIVVDSCVWADYFNGTTAPSTDRLDEALSAEEDIAVLPIVVTEILQGFRSDTAFETARSFLVALPVVYPTLSTHVRAARLYRTLRGQGLTVSRSVDCLIAQTCLDHDAELLSSDADFRRIAGHSALRLWTRDSGPQR